MEPSDATRSIPRLGIDLGGTKIEIIALDGEGRELLRRRVATPRGDYAATLDAIARLVEASESALGSPGRASIGIGTPGTHSRASGLMRNCNSVWLNGRPLRADLVARLERPVTIANDANCFALSEATDGAGAGADCVFGVILGTGVGGGLVVHGRVLDGPNGIAGEWGHNPLPWPEDDERPGPDCYCGKRGCIETFLSGPGLANDHAQATGERLLPEQIVDYATKNVAACVGDAGALRKPARTLACARDQRPRSGRDRARRGLVEPRPVVRAGSAALGRVGVLRSRGYAARAPRARRFERRARCGVAGRRQLKKNRAGLPIAKREGAG